MKLTAKDLTITALFSAILCIFSVITIPAGIIPVTLSTFAVTLTAVVLGAKRAVTSVLTYIIIGLLGLPVFSGFNGGIHVIFGPTGGYLTSYVIMALIVGLASDRFFGKKSVLFLSGLAGLFLCYIFGTVQYMLIVHAGFSDAVKACVLVFIPIDIVKTILAVIIGIKLKNRLMPLNIFMQ